MRHADAEWADRVRHPMAMMMGFLSLMAMKVNMVFTVMTMAVYMPPFAVQLSREHPTKDDE